MSARFDASDRLGLLRPAIDAHSLGIASILRLVSSCGLSARAAGEEERRAADDPSLPGNARVIRDWIAREGITALGFSYRLDPEDGARLFGKLVDALRAMRLMGDQGGRIRALYFAGLPAACDAAEREVPGVDGLFRGDETDAECLDLLGIPRSRLPAEAAAGALYDEARLAFGRELVARGDYEAERPVDRSSCPLYGRRGDRLASRVEDGKARGLPPLLRAHVGPYLPDRKAAVGLFLDWTARIAASGMLDVLSIGSSQLSQSAFGEEWGEAPNGGGVPLNSPEEYEAVWKAARPMLVRTYAGTKGILGLARMYEERIDIAWHALSLWWFSRLDGRGPNAVLDNLREHFEVIRYAAATGKPFEPNVPHHFAFRGADDVTYVVSGYLAAAAAKAAGVRDLVLQIMLNTPKSTLGLNDLAKARALLAMVRGLEGPGFRVILQPRAGLDYFSRDEAKAKAQLAASAALMDDIESGDDSSPSVIHVVGWSEAIRLADPEVVAESARITRRAIAEYRSLRKRALVDDMSRDGRVEALASRLLADARATVAAIESSIPDPYSPLGLYRALSCGFLVAPDLASLREEFAEAARWRTGTVGGGVAVVDEEGRPVPIAARLAEAAEAARGTGGRA